MKKIILVLVAMIALMAVSQAQQPARIEMSKKHACIGERIAFNDRTTRTTNITGRKWQIADSTIIGSSLGGYETVYASFTTDSNIIELEVYFETNDTIIDEDGEMIVNVLYDTTRAIDTLFVFVPPVSVIEGDDVVCKDGFIDLQVVNTIPQANYAWYSTMDNEGTPPVSYGSRLRTQPAAAVNRYYLAVSDAYGCVVWDSINAYMLDNSLRTIPEDGKICEGQEATIIAGMADHYLWESIPADTTLDSLYGQAAIVVKPSSTTVYAMTPYGSNGCAGERVTATITVVRKPQIDISYSPATIDPESPMVYFSNNTEGSVYSFWSFGRRLTAEGSMVEHIFSGIYADSVSVRLTTRDEHGCEYDTTFKVPVQQFATWFPNAFTPNRSENSTFAMRTINSLDHFSINIYNREGLLVFESEDPSFVWDGSHKGKDCPQGVYVYVCRYRLSHSSNLENIAGTVTLLR